VYGGPCRHCAVLSLSRFISGYYTDVNKKTFIVFMLHACCIQAEIMWLLSFLMPFVINFLFVIHLILGSHVVLFVIANQRFIAFPH
jgi:hypothetical protein